MNLFSSEADGHLDGYQLADTPETVATFETTYFENDMASLSYYKPNGWGQPC